MEIRKHCASFFGLLILVVMISGCSSFDKEADYPSKALEIKDPGGASLIIAPEALDQREKPVVEDLGAGESINASSPLAKASNEYLVDLGDAVQIGEITMTVPLYGSGKDSALAGSDRVYAVWAEPIGELPAMVGATVEAGLATFPIVGSGKYQVFGILSHEALLEMVNILDPLAVPTYQQRTSSWCSPTAMTDLAQFHEGAWPVGGQGAIWGETSNYYLAGKASQPFDKGYFFHWLLGAGGYQVPSDTKQSFFGSEYEVVVWNWKAWVGTGFIHENYAEPLFDFFRAYVEGYLWGANSARRPVAWGSSLAGHSRIITGSDGEIFYYNDPSNGSLNETRSWDEYLETIQASVYGPKTEIVDTVIFHAPPRSVSERTGVIWLYPGNESPAQAGSVALISGLAGIPNSNWVWDGAGGHSEGYYYQAEISGYESDPVYGMKFEVKHIDDTLDVRFRVKNITQATRDFNVNVYLSNDSGTVNEMIFSTGYLAVGSGAVESFWIDEGYRLANKPPGIYTVKFVLDSNGVIADVKYVNFALNDQEKIFLIPHGTVIMRAFCRSGPDPVFDPAAILEPGTELEIIGVNPARSWGLVEVEVDGEAKPCWVGFGVLELVNEEQAEIAEVPPMPISTKAPGGGSSGTGSSSCSDIKSEDKCESFRTCYWIWVNDTDGLCLDR